VPSGASRGRCLLGRGRAATHRKDSRPGYATARLRAGMSGSRNTSTGRSSVRGVKRDVEVIGGQRQVHVGRVQLLGRDDPMGSQKALGARSLPPAC